MPQFQKVTGGPFTAKLQVSRSMSSEEWRVISDLPAYEISSNGRVRRKQKILKQQLEGGYMKICLSSNRKARWVHRLVALAFLTNSQNKATVNHKNHNRSDNRVSNLEWATAVEQNNHSRKSVSAHGRAVQQFTMDGRLVGQYHSLREAAQALGKDAYGAHLISLAASDPSKAAHGFKWRFCGLAAEAEVFETWRMLPELGEYQISSLGRLKSKRGRVMTGSIHSHGYRWFKVNGRSQLAHILVARAFVANPDQKPNVNHIDGVKSNSSADNLEWCTQSENAIHAAKSGLRRPANKRVHQLDLEGRFIRSHLSIKSASSHLGLSKASSSIGCVAKKNTKCKTAHGFLWQFAE